MENITAFICLEVKQQQLCNNSLVIKRSVLKNVAYCEQTKFLLERGSLKESALNQPVFEQ